MLHSTVHVHWQLSEIILGHNICMENRKKLCLIIIFIFFILIEYVLMIQKTYSYIPIYFFHLKNAERPKSVGDNTCKSMGGVLCLMRC